MRIFLSIIVSFLLLITACAPREGYLPSSICQDSTYLALKTKGYMNLSQAEKDLYIVLNDSCHNEQMMILGSMAQESYDAWLSYALFIILVAGIAYFLIE